MPDLATGFASALEPVSAARRLAEAVEAQLGGAGRVAGALVLSSLAGGPGAVAAGTWLAARWPEAELVGTSFEGLLAGGRVHRDEPVIAILAWAGGAGAPLPFVWTGESEGAPPDHGAADELEALLGERGVGPAAAGARDLLVLFPDASATAGLESTLDRVSARLGGFVSIGAAASGVGGLPSHAWHDGESTPGATLGLWLTGGASDARLARASASRRASPWLEIGRCRERWVDTLDGEPALDWLRRQLGLDAEDPVEPLLDRLLVRIGEAGRGWIEHYVVGIDPRRGSLAIAGQGPLRRGGRLAFALPDGVHARERLRAAVAGLAPSPGLLQLACRARDASLHGDADLEPALVSTADPARWALGTQAPFQLAPGPGGRTRLMVHTTVLAALGQD